MTAAPAMSNLMIYSVDHGHRHPYGGRDADGCRCRDERGRGFLQRVRVRLCAKRTGHPLHPGTPAGPTTVQEYAVNTDGTLNLQGTPLTWVADSRDEIGRHTGRKVSLHTNQLTLCHHPPRPSTLTAYSVDPTTGALAAGASRECWRSRSRSDRGSSGPFPLSVRLIPARRTQASAVVTSYAIDSSSGSLTAVGTGTTVQSNVGQLLPDPSGVSLYMANNLNFTAAQDSLQALSIDQTGAITVNGPIMQTNPAGSGTLATALRNRPVDISTWKSPYQQVSGGTATNSALLSTFSVSTAEGTAGQLVSVGSSIILPSTSTGSMALRSRKRQRAGKQAACAGNFAGVQFRDAPALRI